MNIQNMFIFSVDLRKRRQECTTSVLPLGKVNQVVHFLKAFTLTGLSETLPKCEKIKMFFRRVYTLFELTTYIKARPTHS